MALKTECVAIKVTPEEKEKIKAEADKLDITVSKHLYNKLFKEENITIEKMINELKHYTNNDLYDCTINQIISMYYNLFGKEGK